MAIDWAQVNKDVVSTLRDLIRFDTSNPPGNEIASATYIRDRLATAGIEAVVLESEPGRGNVVGRLRGDGSKRPLLLMSHLDVVPADASRWSCPPFAGEVKDGFVWGRGAVDMKCTTAMHLEIMLLLKRLGVPLRRDVILAGTADEEVGGFKGMGWLVENHWPLIDCEYALDEGGGYGSRIGDRWAFLCQTAQRGVCRLKMRGRGEPAHVSMAQSRSAVAKLAAAIYKLTDYQFPLRRSNTIEGLVNSLSQVLPSPLDKGIFGLLDPATERRVLDNLPSRDIATILVTSLHNTATPIDLRTDDKHYGIPSVAEAEFNCRLIPGCTSDDLIAEIREVVGDEVEIEVTKYFPGEECAHEGPLWEAICEVMGELEPGSLTVPYVTPGMTDGRYVNARGASVYGFSPMKMQPGEPSIGQLMHGDNERISIDNLAFGTNALWEIVRRCCAE